MRARPPKLPPDLPLEVSRFWVAHGHEWEPCHVGDCYTPVMPELRLTLEPRCFWHRYMDAVTATKP